MGEWVGGGLGGQWPGGEMGLNGQTRVWGYAGRNMG